MAPYYLFKRSSSQQDSCRARAVLLYWYKFIPDQMTPCRKCWARKLEFQTEITPLANVCGGAECAGGKDGEGGQVVGVEIATKHEVG